MRRSRRQHRFRPLASREAAARHRLPVTAPGKDPAGCPAGFQRISASRVQTTLTDRYLLALDRAA
jgi:hypothetical protein